MKKTLYLFIFIFGSFLLSVGEAKAGYPKTDIPGAVAKVSEEIGRATEKISEKWKEIEKTINESFIGKGISEFKKAKDEIKTMTSEVKDKVDAVVDPVKDKVESGVDYVKDAKEKADKAVETAEKYSGTDAETVKKMGALEVQKAQINSDYDAQIEGKKEVYDGKIKALDDNIAAITEQLSGAGITEDKKLSLEQMLLKNNEDKANLLAEQTVEEQDINAEKAQKTKVIDDQIAELRKTLTSDVANELKGKTEKYWSKRDTQKAMEEDKEALFLSENEAETSKAINNIRASRRANSLSDIIYAFNTSIKSRVAIEEMNKNSKDLVDISAVAESQNAAIVADTEIKLDELKALLYYNQILAAEIRLSVSNAIAKSSDYKDRDETRDITKFNFEDYDFEKNCKKTGGK